MKTKTPIYDFVTEYITKDMSRLHMPGHKGQSILGIETRDITEIKGADYLLEAETIIAESQAIATKLFASGCTIYSTEGSTLAIKTMLRMAMECTQRKHPGKEFRILAARNAHISFIHACGLLDIHPKWLFSRTNDAVHHCQITGETLQAALAETEEQIDAVYLTSPDYAGHMADIQSLARICHERDILLLVDNAHGAYLHFLEEPLHPLDLGADMCCDSAHKTLPVLTGGAYLHLSKRLQDVYEDLYDSAKKAMSLFASTSPSYLILQSLDLCNAYLADDFRSQLAMTCKRIAMLQEELNAAGIKTMRNEPLKLVIDCADLGVSGEKTADHLRSYQIECEYADRYDLVLMISTANTERDYARVKEALSALGKNRPLSRQFPAMPKPPERCTIREALLAPSRRLSVEKAAGQICASPAYCYPPGVPVVISGELISQQTVSVLEWYGIIEIDITLQRPSEQI